MIYVLIILATSLLIFFFSIKFYLLEKEIKKINNKKVTARGNGIYVKIGDIDDN